MFTRIVGSLKQIGLRISTLTRASTIREIVIIWWIFAKRYPRECHSLQCAASDRDGSEDLKGRFWRVQCWKTWSKDWWVLERDWASFFSQAEFETTYSLKLGRPPTRHESLDPIPCRREPPQSTAIVVVWTSQANWTQMAFRI